MEMKTIINYRHFFAYSENSNKYFYAKFEDGINIIYGRNTSGKSTLIQAINYTFGVNDEIYKLDEILREKVIFRLDIEVLKEKYENVIIIRDSDFLYIKREGNPIVKFSGISGNKSEAHKQLKQFISELMGFDLFLESTDEYKPASIEVMFLPYYVSQDYGWVLILKSFRGLDFFKNFKSDYYDYYLGINQDYDRLEKQQLENERKDLENESKFLVNTERKNDKLQLSKLKDEAFIVKSAEYIETYKETKGKLIEKEKEYIIESNNIRFLEERKSILSRVKTAITQQNPLDSACPTCNQPLPSSLERIYEYFQDVDDTKEQLNRIKDEIIKKTGSLYSTKKKIKELRDVISKGYSILKDYKIEDLSVDTWIQNKTNVELSENILKRIGEIKISLRSVGEKLSKYKTDDQIKNERSTKEYLFKRYFDENMKILNVNDFGEKYSLYSMTLFPQQGVELLKTLLAYYFAFNKIIKETTYVHRLPFVLDAIFKEDVDDENRERILKFIYSNKPSDTQMIFSISESSISTKKVEDYNKEIFNNSANLIIINKDKERAFLRDYEADYDELKNETLRLIE